MTGLLRAIYAVGDPPCVELQCPYLSLCAREALVCVSFRDWTNNGVVKPKKQMQPDMTRIDWRERCISHEQSQILVTKDRGSVRYPAAALPGARNVAERAPSIAQACSEHQSSIA